MQMETIHTVPVADGWEIRVDGAETPLSRHVSKMDAVHAGRMLARQADATLVVHRRDGAPPARLRCRRPTRTLRI
jgi:hypothetical protein